MKTKVEKSDSKDKCDINETMNRKTICKYPNKSWLSAQINKMINLYLVGLRNKWEKTQNIVNKKGGITTDATRFKGKIRRHCEQQ